MTLSDVSIKNPVFAWMLMFALIFFGWIAFERLGVSQLPDVDFPIVTVQLTYDGASPEVMEVDVVDIVEDAVMTVQGIRNITSSSKNESATVSIEFELSRDIDDAVQEVQSKIAQVQSRLPTGIESPTVIKNNPEDQPIMWLSLSGDLPSRDIMTYARDNLKTKVQTVPGVSEIILGGYISPVLRLWVDPQALNQYELTVQDVINAIGKEHVEIPAGRVESATKEFNLRFMGEAMNEEQFSQILIPTRGGKALLQPVTIGDVARVERGLDDVRRISRTNFKSAIGLGIKKQRGANSVEVAKQVKKRVEAITADLPQGLAVRVNFDSTKFIEQSTHELNFTLLLSAFLTAVVCLFFLGSLRSAINILMAIPTSIIGSFLVLYFLGFTRNTFTLLGLILAIGIVVDDAIMVLENIIRHQEMGKNKLDAAREGAREITPAAVAATIAIIAIFIPIIFMEGVIGRFFFQFGVTMSVTVALSLLEALTLTPMRAARFVGIADNRLVRFVDKMFLRTATLYQKSIDQCLQHRWSVIAAALVFFGVSLLTVPALKKEFMPSQDQSTFLIRLEAPLGSSIQFMDQKTMEAEKMIMQHPEVLRYYVAVGGFGGGDVNTAMMFVTLHEIKDRPIDPATGRKNSQHDVMDLLRKELPQIANLKAILLDMAAAGSGSQRGAKVEFSIRGPDWERLTALSLDFTNKMKSGDQFIDIDTNYKYGMPEIQILPKRDEAAKRNVSMEEIGSTINALVGGMKAGKFTENGRRNDVQVRVQPDQVSAQDVVKNLYVRNTQGELIPLADVVQMAQKETLQSITRENRERSVSIYANIPDDVSLDKALNQIAKWGKESLPEGYHVVFTGSAQTFKESFQNLLMVLLLGIVVSYMVLGSQYNSFVHPITVLLALPFSVSGAFVALWISGQSLNIFSFIGLILLMGIVKKNSILLVDFTNQRRAEGLSVHEALRTACPQRLRPILMTSFATLAAAIPPALGLGAGAETQVSMAVVVLGGVLVSTILTLFVVPCAYSLMTRLERTQPAT